MEHLTKLLNGASTVAAGTTVNMPYAGRTTFQGIGRTTAGAGAATILVQVSNEGTQWMTAGTISLTLATTDSSDGFAFDAPWGYVRGNVTAISGTGATVDLLMQVSK